jgi:hypothetical protein
MRPPHRAQTGDLPYAPQGDRRADPAETLDHALHPLGARTGVLGELFQKGSIIDIDEIAQQMDLAAAR